MDWIKPYLVSRARVAALRAMVEGGGEVRPEQLARAIAPVLGDLLPLPTDSLPTIAERAKATTAGATWSRESDRRQAMGPSTAGSARESTVDKKAQRKRKR